MRSLRTRLLVVASCVLAAFLAVCAEGLTQAFRSSALQVQRDRMEAMVLALLGAAESTDNGTLTIPSGELPEPRFARVDSGLEALIFNESGGVVWRSPNFTGDAPEVLAPAIGVMDFNRIGKRFAMIYGVRWVGEANSPHPFGGSISKSHRYTVAVFENADSYNAQLAVFSRTLWIGLGASGVVLILVQLLVLRWGLVPLQRLATEMHRIEAGDQARIEGRYPTELTPVAEGINAMIQNERSQQTRYRNALGDLAHSLKTPLAVLRGLVETTRFDTATRAQFEDPLQRLQDITDYQLKRASTAGRRALSEPIAPRPIVEKTLAALTKVYADKRIVFGDDVPERLRLRADAGDLYELFGNLLDNAAKWCRERVNITVVSSGRRVQIDVDDDGPGFPEQAEALLRRGVRADSRTPGQGIGLATVADIVTANEGSIEFLRSPLGGGRVRIGWPI